MSSGTCSFSTKTSSKRKCSNFECYASASEAKLKVCARCKIVQYCSRECQVAHWKLHKPTCQVQVEHAEALAKADERGLASLYLPPGLSLTELDLRLEKWVKFHNLTLMGTCIHALDLPRDLSRARTHILRVTVSYRDDNGGEVGKYFKVDDAVVVETAVARTWSSVWRQSLEGLEPLREECERTGRGTVTAIGLECDPLSVQIVPFGSMMEKELKKLPVVPRWKEILKDDVQNGRKFSHWWKDKRK